MNKYTPTTAVVREQYAELASIWDGKPRSESWEEFNRWHTDVTRKAKNQARAEALTKARQWLDRIAPNGLISKADVLADLDLWADRATRGIQPNGNPYAEE